MTEVHILIRHASSHDAEFLMVLGVYADGLAARQECQRQNNREDLEQAGRVLGVTFSHSVRAHRIIGAERNNA